MQAKAHWLPGPHWQSPLAHSPMQLGLSAKQVTLQGGARHGIAQSSPSWQ